MAQTGALLEFLDAEGHAGERAGILTRFTAASTAAAAARAASAPISTKALIGSFRSAITASACSTTSTALRSPDEPTSAIAITSGRVSSAVPVASGQSCFSRSIDRSGNASRRNCTGRRRLRRCRALARWRSMSRPHRARRRSQTWQGMNARAAAVKLFASAVSRTGIRDIANEAGLSSSTLYWHVGTKENLLLA